MREAQAVDVRGEFSGQDARQTRVSVNDRVRELEQEHVRLTVAAQASESVDRELSAEVADLEQRSAESEQALMEWQSRLAVDSQRLRRLDEEISIRLRDAGVDGTVADPNSINGLLESLRLREANLRRVVAGLESIVSIQEENERQTQLATLKTREDELESRLGELARAKTRFDSISAAIQHRGETEARNALMHQTGAIQECLSALLPHRHLDRVVWDEASAAILVTDRLLASAVRPDLYTSTGQMNVLALAVFFGVALLQRITTLDFLALDEPIQNLDDVHFLAFVTLVKRISGSRQVILSTADRNFAELLRRQMKNLWETGEYAQYEWKTFESGVGPEVVKLGSRTTTQLGSKTSV